MTLHILSQSGLPDTRTLNQPTSAADSACEDMAGEADEPPDGRIPAHHIKYTPTSKTTFQKLHWGPQKRQSLLTKQIQHSSESEDPHIEDEDLGFSEANRAQSSASTYSRGSVASMTEFTSDGGHSTSPRPSPPTILRQPSLNQKIPNTESVASSSTVTQQQAIESQQKLEAELKRKRCITFACGSKAGTKVANAAESKATQPAQPAKRPCALKFLCPTRDGAVPCNASRSRLASPPPPTSRRRQTSPKPHQNRPHRGSDTTLRNSSPRTVRKVPAAAKQRRGSDASDMSRTEATRFHEFAGSEGEDDDWIKESGCHRRVLTVDDTLAVENDLRRLVREAEEEDEEEDDDSEDDGEGDGEDDEDADDDVVHTKPSPGSEYESDEGFHTDDEDGFAHSDDEDDGNPDYDWWAPARRSKGAAAIEHIRPTERRDSGSSIGSGIGPFPGVNHVPKVRRRRSRPMDVNNPPELPDSTDFVCGTLDEDQPLEKAYMAHLEQRRKAKHRTVPQDIDPTFPTSDPEMDEEDEISEMGEEDSDHPVFLHGTMEMNSDGGEVETGITPRVVPRKRSPVPSPPNRGRLRSPPPNKRISLHRSPPPAAHRHHHNHLNHQQQQQRKSPAPGIGFTTAGASADMTPRISFSVPRNEPYKMRGRHIYPAAAFDGASVLDDDDDDTPRFNRRAIDIVMGLEKKRQRRREKVYERHCRKARLGNGGKTKSGTERKREVQPGKGAERMRDLGIGLNAYRGKGVKGFEGVVVGANGVGGSGSANGGNTTDGTTAGVGVGGVGGVMRRPGAQEGVLEESVVDGMHMLSY